MTTTITVAAHCNPDTEVQVTVTDPSFKFGPELTILQDGETTEKVVFDDRSITIREVMLQKMGEVQDGEATAEQAIEQEIQDKGLTAPRITPDHIESVIKGEFYFTAGDGVFGASGHRPNSVRAGAALGLLTFCVLTLQNGFTVTGESACASPENFDAEIGRKIARENAREKIWLLEGYLLKQKLFDRERGYSIGLPHDGSPLTSASVGGNERDAGLASSNIKRDNSLILSQMLLEHDAVMNSGIDPENTSVEELAAHQDKYVAMIEFAKATIENNHKV